MSPQSSPRVFRILMPSEDLERSRQFYESLLGVTGRPVAPGRYYFDCGPVLLGLIGPSSSHDRGRGAFAEAVYLATDQLERVHERARQLGCLSKELLHDDPDSPMGEIRVRPWGERSFYLDDPSGNPLCFVDDRTLFTGTPDQVRALAGSDA